MQKCRAWFNSQSLERQSQARPFLGLSAGAGKSAVTGAYLNIVLMNQIEAHLDWITHSLPVPIGGMDDIVAEVSAAWQETIALAEEPVTIGQRYQLSYRGPTGMLVALRYPEKGREQIDTARMLVSLPGKCLAERSWDVQKRAIQTLVLDKSDTSVSRVDLDLDCPKSMVTPELAAIAVRNGDYVGPQYAEVIESGRRGNWATSVYIAAPGASRRLLVYDKDRESKQPLDCTRLELRLSDRRAAAVVARIVAAADPAETLAGEVTGWVQFRKRKAGVRIDRCKELAWWSKVKSCAAGKVAMTMPRRVSTLDSTLAWTRKQVLPTMHMLRAAAGSDSKLVGLLYPDGAIDNQTILSQNKQDRINRWIQELKSDRDKLHGLTRDMAAPVPASVDDSAAYTNLFNWAQSRREEV